MLCRLSVYVVMCCVVCCVVGNIVCVCYKLVYLSCWCVCMVSVVCDDLYCIYCDCVMYACWCVGCLLNDMYVFVMCVLCVRCVVLYILCGGCAVCGWVYYCIVGVLHICVLWGLCMYRCLCIICL